LMDNCREMSHTRCFLGPARLDLGRTTLFVALAFALWPRPAAAAPITWEFETTLSIYCVGTGGTCPASVQPYLALHNSTVYGRLTFDSSARDGSPDPEIGIYAMGLWTLEVPVFDTTWSSMSGSLEVGTVDVPKLGAFQCYGCLAAFGYFSQNSNPSAPAPPGGSRLPFEFRMFGPQFTTDALPVGLTSFQAAGGFFVGESEITARPFTVRAVPEPATITLIGSSAALALARRRRRRHHAGSPGAAA